MKFKTQRLLNDIQKMDTSSEDFVDLYHEINKKYFTVEKPDDYQAAAIVLNMVLHRGEEWMVEVLAKFAQGLFEVVDKNIPASHASFEIRGGKTFFYDVYQNKDALEQVHKLFKNAVIMNGGKS